MRFTGTIALVVALAILCFVDNVEARHYRRAYRASSFGGARPATGYGANIHRNFILKQEARRVSQGRRVRNRGNVLWYR